jgi:release factor glutamine methyltransferase
MPEMPSTPTTPDPGLVARLRAAGCVFAEEEAALLEEAATTGPELEALAARRIAGEPLEQVVGWAEFAGLRIVVEPGVFVPRRRTEFLAAEAARLAAAVAVAGRVPVVVDLCCGAGAIGAAVASAAGPIDLIAADIDPAAVRAARRNLEPLGARVVEGDLFEALPSELRGRVDVLAVNAPYVPTEEIAMMPPEARDHEARVALDGGADGARAPSCRGIRPGMALAGRSRADRDEPAPSADDGGPHDGWGTGRRRPPRRGAGRDGRRGRALTRHPPAHVASGPHSVRPWRSRRDPSRSSGTSASLVWRKST